MLPVARLVNLTVGARDEAFQVAARVRFCGQRADLGQAGGRAVVEIMKSAQLIEGEGAAVVRLDLVQRGLQLRPVRPFVRDEFLQVDDHGAEA